jgi:prevent-host-death family protein
MVRQVNVAEAKAKLSQLLDEAAAGKEVVIARAGKPVARLTPVEEPQRRLLGFLNIQIPDEFFFDPLPEDELALWE